jgi:hypothetical protein
VNKQRSHRFHTDRFNLKTLKEKYHVYVLNRFSALEGLDIGVENNSAGEMVMENIKISAKESL